MDQEQQQLFYDSPEQAVDDAIRASGKTYKAVAVDLWPALKPDTAYARLKNCLRDDKDEKLSFGEIILICRIAGRFDPLYFMADELHHSRPEPRAPKDEAAQILAQYQQVCSLQKSLQDRLERILDRDGELLRAVK